MSDNYYEKKTPDDVTGSHGWSWQLKPYSIVVRTENGEMISIKNADVIRGLCALLKMKEDITAIKAMLEAKHG